MGGARIVVVGGGSQAFGPELCESLVDMGRDQLVGAEVVLLDVVADHVEAVAGFASGLAERVGADVRFEATTDRRRAFDGAGFIINTFRPGSHREQELDETIPARYGLQGNETIGIGGIFMACRGVPVLREILADAEACCPDAWIINYTNPTQYVADAIGKLSSMRVVGLCDGQWDVVDDLAYLLGIDRRRIAIHPAGTNHAFWVMRFTIDGDDGYPALGRRVEERGPAELERMFTDPALMDGSPSTYDQIYKQFIPHSRFDFSLRLFRLFGLLPGPKYYWRYLLDQDAMIEEQRHPDFVTMARFYMEQTAPRIFGTLDQRLPRAAERIVSSERKDGEDDIDIDLSVRVIASMANDLGRCLVVNVPNRGAVSNLPDDAIVEVSALVGREGPRPFAEGALPAELVGFQHALVLAQKLSVDAAINGSREDLLKAIVAHPLINSLDAAERCMDDMLERLGPWLPQFDG